MKKLFKTKILLFVLALFLFTACTAKTTITTIPTTTQTTTTTTQSTGMQAILERLEFAGAEIEYDGEYHSLEITNLPEGVTVTYKNNKKKSPGNHKVTAVLKYEDITVEKYAYLLINKGSSTITAETEQFSYINGGNIKIDYSINHKDHNVIVNITKNGVPVTEKDLYNGGVFNVEIYGEEGKLYKETEHINITFTVSHSKYGLSFTSKEETYDGSEKSIEFKGDVPQGYTVEYTNNIGTETGTYRATAVLKNASGEVVETHYAVLIIENPKNQEFEAYLDEFFVTYLEGDQLTINIFFENPADFGFEHYDATWYTYETMTSEDYVEAVQEFQAYLEELKTFENARLSDLQQVAYNKIYYFLNYYIEYYSIEDVFHKQILYVDQFGGYVADFGTYMEAYELRTETEVQDIVSYITSTSTAFPSYLLFVQEKAEKGYALSDTTINKMIEYLNDISLKAPNYYLVEILEYKINAVDFLSETKKANYINQVKDAVTNHFFPGVNALKAGLEECLGTLKKEDEGYWATYEDGSDLFALELENLLGIDGLTMKDYTKKIEDAFKSYSSKASSAITDIVNKFGIGTYDELYALIEQYPIYEGTPEEMMEYLKEFAKTIVPELETEPVIKIKNMDAATQKVSNAVAYYMKSPLDNTGSEDITLNPSKLGDANDVLGTLAHEGYPGHLYAYVYSKQLDTHNLVKVMTSTAHAEGWATYVQLALFDYAKASANNDNFSALIDYQYANELAGFLLECRIDLGIHYEGWTVEQVAAFLDKYNYNSDAAQEIYDLLVEIPTQYAAYGYGKIMFYEMHQEAKKVLGNFYDEVEFNEMLHSKGWSRLDELKNTYNEYMANKCHELGLKYTAK